MSSWTPEQLAGIATADELRITTFRKDGTWCRPLPIWVVRHGDGLYVRSYRGEAAGWYRNVRTNDRGRIAAGGVEEEVTVCPVTDDDLNAEIDAAYTDKYGRYGPRFLEPMVAPTARATTLKLIPRTSNP